MLFGELNPLFLLASTKKSLIFGYIHLLDRALGELLLFSLTSGLLLYRASLGCLFSLDSFGNLPVLMSFTLGNERLNDFAADVGDFDTDQIEAQTSGNGVHSWRALLSKTVFRSHDLVQRKGYRGAS